MVQQFLLIGPADEVEANHLVSPLGRLFASPQGDQQASDDGTVCLNLDPDWIGTKQVTTTENVFKETEEDFSVPIILPPKMTLLSA